MQSKKDDSSRRVSCAPQRARQVAIRPGGGFAAAALALIGMLGLAPGPSPRNSWLLRSDPGLLDEIERRAVLFFCEQTDAATGLTRDRAPAAGSPSRAPASVAASGFALTAWCIGAERGWLDLAATKQRVLTLLRFVDRSVAREHGWLYHFVDIHTGARMWRCEASTIDTALFLQGAILAREYLCDPEVTALVDRIYGRVDWVWALNGERTLTHGWLPETGFIDHRWDQYSELLSLYLLGIAAPARALPADSWDAWRREPVAEYGGRMFVSSPSLFAHQYSHAWFDFRGRHDLYLDYWENSVEATLAQRDWCASLSGRFDRWSRDLWGVTASDSSRGYMDWGGPAESADKLDGTVVPCAPGGSLPFAPRECLQALRRMLEVGGRAVWGRYGFADAFNPQTGWVSQDVIAIDVGITLAMAENLRSGFCWKQFMRAPETRRALELAGFVRKSPLHPFKSPVLAAATREIRRREGVLAGLSAAGSAALRIPAGTGQRGASRRVPDHESGPIPSLLADGTASRGILRARGAGELNRRSGGRLQIERGSRGG